MGAVSFAALFLFSGPAGAVPLGTTARQLPKGSLKLLAYYQGVQDQTLNFNIISSQGCATPNGVAFNCGQGGDFEIEGQGGAGMLKLVYQPHENLQYYGAVGAGNYSLSVPSATISNVVTGDRPGFLYQAGVKAVLLPDTEVSPAVALDLSVARAQYTFNRRHPGGTPGADNRINQRLHLTTYQVAVQASHVFNLIDADEKVDAKEFSTPFRKGAGFKLEPYGGVKWYRTIADLKDMADGSHAGGKKDTATPFLGLRLPLFQSEGLFAEASFIDGYQYAAGLEVRF